LYPPDPISPPSKVYTRCVDRGLDIGQFRLSLRVSLSLSAPLRFRGLDDKGPVLLREAGPWVSSPSPHGQSPCVKGYLEIDIIGKNGKNADLSIDHVKN
jgi:hypothetical protein